jgi:hypothetical protein
LIYFSDALIGFFRKLPSGSALNQWITIFWTITGVLVFIVWRSLWKKPIGD